MSYKNVFDYALKVFLTVSPIFYVALPMDTKPDMAVALGYFAQETFFIFGTVILFCLGMMKKPLRSFSLKSIPGLMIFVVLTSLLFGFGPDLRAKSLNMFFGVVLYKTIFEHFDFSTLKSFAWWFGWLLFVNLVLCAFQINAVPMLYKAVSPELESRMNMVIGFMKLKVHLGVLAGVLAPMILTMAPAFTLCIIPLLYFGQSSSTIAAFVISLSFLTWFKCRKLFFPMMFLLLAGGAWYVLKYDMPGGQFGERLFVWSAAVDHALKTSPVLGEGIGSFAKTNFASIQTEGNPVIFWTWAHNEFVQSFFELGLIGISFIFAYFIGLKKLFVKHKNNPMLQTLGATVIVVVIASFFHFPFHLGRFAGLFIFFLSIFHARAIGLEGEL